MKGERYYNTGRDTFAGDINKESYNKREEVVWVADTNSGKPNDKLDVAMEPVIQLATIVRDAAGKVTLVRIHHQGIGPQDQWDDQYGRDEDYANQRIKIEGDIISGGMEGPLRIVKREVTPEQKWIAKFGVTGTRDKDPEGNI